MKKILLVNLLMQVLSFMIVNGYSQSINSKSDSSDFKIVLPLKITPFCGIKHDTRDIEEGFIRNEDSPHKPLSNCGGNNLDNLINFSSFGISNVPSPDIHVYTSPNTPLFGSEISICVDPNNKNVIREFNMKSDEDVLNYYWSNHRGTDWSGGYFPIEDATSDPTSVIDNEGNWYVCYLTKYVNGSNTNTSVEVGEYFPNNDSWSSYQVASVNNYILDKPHLCIDNSNTNGYLYCAWTPIYVGNDDPPDDNWSIQFKTSSNNSWWSNAQILSQNIYDPHLTINQGVNIQTGPNGEVYIVWAITDKVPENSYPLIPDDPHMDETGLAFIKSTDHGSSWIGDNGYGKKIRTIQGIGNFKGDVSTWGFVDRLNSFPSMCVDKSGGPHNGWIYVVWANHGSYENPNFTFNEIRVYMIYSNDGGDTWSDPIIVNQVSGEGHHSFFPWISCDSETGVLSVVFYDDRYPNITGAFATAYVAMSKDYGSTWQDCRLSDNAFNDPGSNFFGDYIGICSKNSIVYPTFTDTHVSGGYNCLPQVFISPFYAWNCVENYPNPNDLTSVNQTVASYEIREWEVREVTGDINSRNIIEPNGVAIYNAGNQITFLPEDQNGPNVHGFWAHNNSYVHAYIEGCQPFPTSNENNATQKQENISENVTNKEFSQSNFKVYPNPNTGKFEIELNKISPNDLCLIITNASGIVVYSSKSFYKSVINVDISNFPKGIYFVKLFNDSHTYVNKIISY